MLFKNVKTRWISMLSPMKHIMEQYQSLIAQMHVDSLQNNIVNDNLNLLCDLEPNLGLHTILPLLDCVHVLIKLAQSWDIFMCDFIDTMNIFQLKFHHFYNDPYSNLFDPTFDELNVLKMLTNKNLPMSWSINLNNEELDYLVNEFFGAKYSMK